MTNQINKKDNFPFARNILFGQGFRKLNEMDISALEEAGRSVRFSWFCNYTRRGIFESKVSYFIPDKVY